MYRWVKLFLQHSISAQFFSLPIFYWNCKNRYWYAFTSL